MLDSSISAHQATRNLQFKSELKPLREPNPYKSEQTGITKRPLNNHRQHTACNLNVSTKMMSLPRDALLVLSFLLVSSFPRARMGDLDYLDVHLVDYHHSADNPMSGELRFMA